MTTNTIEHPAKKRSSKQRSEFEQVCSMWGVSVENMTEYSKSNTVYADLDYMDRDYYGYQERYC